jgi:type IV pilus assembly protein PilA
MVLKKQLKKNRKKGFTLVEVIVVLVIIAVLAAIAIPALTGYIDKANDRAALTEARTIQVALQEIVAEEYGDGNVANVKGQPIAWGSAITGGAITDKVYERVNGLTGNTYGSGDVSDIKTTGTAIWTFAYKKSATEYVGYNSARTPKYILATNPSDAIKP